MVGFGFSLKNGFRLCGRRLSSGALARARCKQICQIGSSTPGVDGSRMADRPLTTCLASPGHLTQRAQGLYPNFCAVCSKSAGRSSHRRSRGLASALTRYCRCTQHWASKPWSTTAENVVPVKKWNQHSNFGEFWTIR